MMAASASLELPYWDAVLPATPLPFRIGPGCGTGCGGGTTSVPLLGGGTTSAPLLGAEGATGAAAGGGAVRRLLLLLSLRSALLDLTCTFIDMAHTSTS